LTLLRQKVYDKKINKNYYDYLTPRVSVLHGPSL